MDSNKKRNIINISVLAIIVIVIVYLIVRYFPQFTELSKDPEKLKEYLDKYGNWSIPVFIALQALQVVIVAIPGEVVQIAGGYIYGPYLGTLYSVIGILLGTVIIFVIVKLFGYPVLKIFVSEKAIKKYDFILNSPKTEIVLFVLFMIPAFPKDLLTYLGALAPIKPVAFVSIAMLARLPALTVSSFIGSHMFEGNYLAVIIISSIGVILFVVGVLFRDKIINFISKIRKIKN